MRSFSCETHRHNACGLTLLQNPASLALCVPKAEASWDLQEGLTLLQGRAYVGEDLNKIHIHTYGCAKRSSLGGQ